MLNAEYVPTVDERELLFLPGRIYIYRQNIKCHNLLVCILFMTNE